MIVQAYMMRNRALTEALVRRAADAGATAIVLTVDTPYVGRKTEGGGDAVDVPDDRSTSIFSSTTTSAGAVGREEAEQDPSMTEEVIARLADVSGLPPSSSKASCAGTRRSDASTPVRPG